MRCTQKVLDAAKKSAKIFGSGVKNLASSVVSGVKSFESFLRLRGVNNSLIQHLNHFKHAKD